VEFTVGRRTGKQVAGRALIWPWTRVSGTRLARKLMRSIQISMKRTLFTLLSAAALFVISFAKAQTPGANQEQKLLALVKDVQTQQAQMAENEKKIEEMLADLTETIRTARIYTKREK